MTRYSHIVVDIKLGIYVHKRETNGGTNVYDDRCTCSTILTSEST